MEAARSGRIGVVLAALLLVAVVAGGWTVITVDLRARSDTSTLARGAAPASVLLLNLDRDAYQAQLFLERVVQLEEAGIDAGPERDFHTQNVAQLIGDRWTDFRAIGSDIAPMLPGEAQHVARFQADRDQWLTTAAAVMAAAPGPNRDMDLERSKAEFERMRHHLDILEEDFYQPLTDSLGASAVRGINLATIVVSIVLSIAAAMTIVLTGLSISTLRRQDRNHRAREAELLETSRRQRFETQLRRALEMASDEDAAVQVVSRAVAQQVHPFDHAGMVVSDSSRSHLRATYQSGSAPGCTVSSPDDCRALRTGGMQVFDDNRKLDSCPYLTGDDNDCRTAMCAPLNIGGRSTAVIHITRSCAEPFSESELAAVSTIADHGGIRLSVIRNNAVVSKQARTDPLTGLDNRRFFENAIRNMADEGATSMALLMIDLDEFKNLNDSHGHDTGDRALRLFADALRDVTRDTRSSVARWGGEEFVVALPDAGIKEGAALAEKLRNALAVRLIEGTVPSFTISVGVAAASSDVPFTDLIVSADRALYEAKRSGRDCVSLAHDQLLPGLNSPAADPRRTHDRRAP